MSDVDNRIHCNDYYLSRFKCNWFQATAGTGRKDLKAPAEGKRKHIRTSGTD